MSDNYALIVKENLSKLYSNLPDNLSERLPATQENDSFLFKAFGEKCLLSPNGIFLNDKPQTGVKGILISLYALNSSLDETIVLPLKAFKEFPNTMPYVGAFSTHAEQVLIPHTTAIKQPLGLLRTHLGDTINQECGSGDFSFQVVPLPKIRLCYIFYEADEDFPPSVTCLYSSNANRFLPNDALADIGEYTSKKMISLLTDHPGI